MDAPRVPRHKYMAPNGRSNIHNDGYMTDTYTWSGPLGRNLQVRSAAYTSAVFGLCGGTIAFDRRGRVVTVCIAPDFTVRLRLLDPRTLATIASYDLPNRIIPPGANPFQSFTGGGYFYLDNHDRAVIPTSARHLVVVALRGGASTPRWELARDYDVSATVPAGDGIGSVLPDHRGLLWYVTRDAGVIGVVNPRTGKVKTRRLGEAIGNSFAVDPTRRCLCGQRQGPVPLRCHPQRRAARDMARALPQHRDGQAGPGRCWHGHDSHVDGAQVRSHHR